MVAQIRLDELDFAEELPPEPQVLDSALDLGDFASSSPKGGLTVIDAVNVRLPRVDLTRQEWESYASAVDLLQQVYDAHGDLEVDDEAFIDALADELGLAEE